MTCPACARNVLQRDDDEFRAGCRGCRGCQARSVARSDTMATLMDKAKPEDVRMQARADLRELIRVTMPGVDADSAREAVMSWWRAERDT